MDEKIFDVAIIGGGPAGYCAALYCIREGLSSVLLEKMGAGGQMAEATLLENYPGFENGINGFELGMIIQKQVKKYEGIEIKNAEVISCSLKEKIKIIRTKKEDIKTKAVIIATGAKCRHLGLESEEKMLGRGVGYCASCDGMFYRSKDVVIIGGGNTAVADALILSKICSKVTLIHRRDSLRAEKINNELLEKMPNVYFEWNSVVTDFTYGEVLKGVKIKNLVSGEEKEISCQGAFISIGRAPETELFTDEVDLDEMGYIIASEDTKTNIEGVFAAGDVRTKEFRQVITAAADGAIAAHEVGKYLDKIS